MRTQCCCPPNGSPQCADCPQTVPTYRIKFPEVPPPVGWQCPVCGMGCAPWLATCPGIHTKQVSARRHAAMVPMVRIQANNQAAW